MANNPGLALPLRADRGADAQDRILKAIRAGHFCFAVHDITLALHDPASFDQVLPGPAADAVVVLL